MRYQQNIRNSPQSHALTGGSAAAAAAAAGKGAAAAAAAASSGGGGAAAAAAAAASAGTGLHHLCFCIALHGCTAGQSPEARPSDITAA